MDSCDVSGPTLAELVRGPLSLGARLQEGGISAVPSPSIPSPGSDPYFSGGYSTARHGSRYGGEVRGIQVEAHFQGVRDTEENRARFAGRIPAPVDLRGPPSAPLPRTRRLDRRGSPEARCRIATAAHQPCWRINP